MNSLINTLTALQVKLNTEGLKNTHHINHTLKTLHDQLKKHNLPTLSASDLPTMKKDIDFIINEIKFREVWGTSRQSKFVREFLVNSIHQRTFFIKSTSRQSSVLIERMDDGTEKEIGLVDELFATILSLLHNEVIAKSK